MISPFIIVAMTADGFIGKKEDQLSTSWTSKADKKFFVEKTKQAGVVIMGSKTFETFGVPLKDRRMIVYTKDKKYDGVETTSEEPELLLKRLEKEGFKEVAICGGSTIYTLFAEKNLIKKIYITVENVLFGQGISIFNKNLDIKMELISNTKIGESTVLLEYNIINN